MRNKKYLFFIIISFLFFNSCANIKKGIGLEKEIPNEFLIEKKDPLVLPPDYNILPPDSKENKKETKKSHLSIEEILNKDIKNKDLPNSSTKNNSSNLEEEILKKIK
jgi:hypothetical protein